MILLDTHTYYWFINDDARLPKRTKQLILETDFVYISIVSFWELTIKSSIGKIILPDTISVLMESLKKHEFEILSIDMHDLECLQTLDYIHRDPFDRMLISQALSKNLTLISADENIRRYPINTYWDDK